MDQLAECHSRQGHYQEALSIKTEILNHRKLTQGYEHPATLSDMEWIVRLHCEYENYEDAATVLRQVVEGKKVTQGPRHRDTLYTMRILRLLYLHQGIRGEELLAKDVKGLYISRPEEEQTPKRELVAFCQTDHVPKMISGQAPLHSWLHFIKDEPPQEAFQSPAWTRPRDSERGEGNKLCTLDNNHEDSGDSLDDRWSSDDGYYPAFSEESAAEEPSDYPKRARVAKPVQILAEEEEAGLRSEPREKKVVGEASSTVSFSDYSPKSEKAGGYYPTIKANRVHAVHIIQPTRPHVLDENTTYLEDLDAPSLNKDNIADTKDSNTPLDSMGMLVTQLEKDSVGTFQQASITSDGFDEFDNHYEALPYTDGFDDNHEALPYADESDDPNEALPCADDPFDEFDEFDDHYDALPYADDPFDELDDHYEALPYADDSFVTMDTGRSLDDQMTEVVDEYKGDNPRKRPRMDDDPLDESPIKKQRID